MHASRGFFGDAVNMVKHLRIPVMHHGGQVATIIEDHVGIPGYTVFENGLFDAPFTFCFGLAFPRVHGDTCSRYAGSRMILSRKNITG